MSHFGLTDSFADRFAPLEKRPRVHETAITLYALCGQTCARLMTDGAVSDATLIRAVPYWSPKKRAAAIDALLELGLWRRTEGGYTFVDWDLEQRSREAEERRRAKSRESTRAWRARRNGDREVVKTARNFDLESGVFDVVFDDPPLEMYEENGNVTGHVTHDVTSTSTSSSTGRAVPPPDLPTVDLGAQLSLAPPEPKPDRPSLKKAKAPRKPPEKRAVLKRVLSDEGAKLGYVTDGTLSAKQLDALAQKAQKAADLAGSTLDTACARMAQEALLAVQDGRKANLFFALRDWQPVAAKTPEPPPWRQPRKMAGDDEYGHMSDEEIYRSLGFNPDGTRMQRRSA